MTAADRAVGVGGPTPAAAAAAACISLFRGVAAAYYSSESDPPILNFLRRTTINGCSSRQHHAASAAAAAGEAPDASLWEKLGRELEQLCLPERKTHKRLKNRRGLYTAEIQGDLAKAAAELLKPQVETIAILVGSCVNTNMWPPTDTDGPGGAFALAAALWRLSKKIVIVTGIKTLDPKP
ncbi:hypothetical protein Esti_005710 [Eimeria stiedai]